MQSKSQTDPSSVSHFQDRLWEIRKDHLSKQQDPQKPSRASGTGARGTGVGMLLLLALPHPRGLHKSNICLAAASSNVFESIRKICYYKSSAMRLEFIGNHTWGCQGSTSHARRPTRPSPSAFGHWTPQESSILTSESTGHNAKNISCLWLWGFMRPGFTSLLTSLSRAHIFWLISRAVTRWPMGS